MLGGGHALLIVRLLAMEAPGLSLAGPTGVLRRSVLGQGTSDHLSGNGENLNPQKHVSSRRDILEKILKAVLIINYESFSQNFNRER